MMKKTTLLLANGIVDLSRDKNDCPLEEAKMLRVFIE